MYYRYFVYRHIRLDSNDPFYIGMGTRNYGLPRLASWRSQHTRAYTNSSRNKFWHNIVNKTNYKVDIIFRTSSLPEVLKKESEFITLYGRRDIGTGTLVNLTAGGEKYSHFLSFNKDVFVYKSDTGEFYAHFVGIAQAARQLGLAHPTGISCAMRQNKSHYHHGFLFYNKYMGEVVQPCGGRVLRDKILNETKIMCFSKDKILIRIYDNFKEASYITDIPCRQILTACRSNYLCRNMYWKFKEK